MEKLVFRKQRREQRPASSPRGAAGPRAEAAEHGKRAVGWAHGHLTLEALRGRGQSLGGWCVPGTRGGPPAGEGAPKVALALPGLGTVRHSADSLNKNQEPCIKRSGNCLRFASSGRSDYVLERVLWTVQRTDGEDVRRQTGTEVEDLSLAQEGEAWDQNQGCGAGTGGDGPERGRAGPHATDWAGSEERARDDFSSAASWWARGRRMVTGVGGWERRPGSGGPGRPRWLLARQGQGWRGAGGKQKRVESRFISWVRRKERTRK